MIKHISPISGISTYKNKYVATAGYDNRVILWDATRNQAIACGFHDHLANQCQFSPCGNYLVSSSSDYSARLWSIPDMRLQAVFARHEDDVESISFHANKPWIATASRDTKIRVFDFTGQLIAELQGHRRDVISIAWLNDYQLISSSDDGTVKCWDVNLKKLIKNIDLGGVETDTIAISQNGVIFAGNDAGEIIIIKDNKQKVIPAHHAGIKRLCYSAKKTMLVSLSYDRSANLWWVKEDGELVFHRSTHLPGIVWARSCDFLGDKALVFVTFGSSYAIYDYINNQWHTDHIKDTFGKNAVLESQHKIYSVGDAGIVMQDNQPVSYLPSLCNFLVECEDIILTGGQTGQLFNALTGKIIYQHRSPLNCATFFIKNKKPHVIVGSYTGEGIIFEKDGNKLNLKATVLLHENAIKGIASSDRYIFSVCASSAAAYHAIDNFELLKYLPSAHDKIANGCAWLKDDCFASISRDLTLRIISLNDQKIIFTPHHYSIKCIAVSADKRWVATGGYFGDIHIYDVMDKSWLSWRPTIAGISSLCSYKEESTFLASSYDGKIYKINLKENYLKKVA